MTVRRTIVVRNRAAKELANIAESIARSVSLESSRTWRNRIETVIRALESDADQWPEAEESSSLGIELRCRLFGRHRHFYRILFTIDGDIVNVLRIRHTAQDFLAPDEPI